MIKKLIILFFVIVCSCSLIYAENEVECLVYGKYCIKDLIPTYKLLGEPVRINDKVIAPKQFTGNFALYAKNYCSSMGYRIPRVDEAQEILNYLLWVPYETNHLIWLENEDISSSSPQALDYNKRFNEYMVRRVRASTQGVQTMCIKDIAN